MLETIVNFTPILIFFILGYVFKAVMKFPDVVGQFLSKLILKVTIPATVFLSVSSAANVSDHIMVPFLACSLQLVLFVIFRFVAKRLHLEAAEECVMSAVPLIANTLIFMAPFFYFAYGDVGMIQVVLYYMGNAVTIYFVAPFVYNMYNNKGVNIKSGLKAIFTSFPVWAFFIGLLWNVTNWGVPAPIESALTTLKTTSVFITMFFLGFRFTPHITNKKLVFGTIAMKNVLGLAIGICASLLLPNTLDKLTIIMGAVAPIGVMGLVYADVYLKDTKFASSLVSYAMVVGVVVYTLMISFFQAYIPIN